jgi:predicted MFS family arabinose efflux permease
MNQQKRKTVFSRYEAFIIIIISLLQFTVILDFMVMAPLGALLLRILHISPGHFGWVVSGYAFSAGASGILAAGFADKFDRKKMLLFFYTGFIVGTLLCGIAPDYHFLLIARIVTGLFGGVMASINMAIIADLFQLEKRGRVMGFVQMAYAVSQAVGIPVGLFLATNFGWHMPFLMIIALCLIIYVAIIIWVKPINGHLKDRAAFKAFPHLIHTASQKRYIRAFMTTVFLSTGAFLLQPFASSFYVYNVGISENMLFIVFMVAGLAGLVTGPLIGRWSDGVGKFKVFLFGTALAMIMIPVITHLFITPFWIVLILNTIMYTAVSSRAIPSQALISGVPDAKDRGAFMSVNASVQQMGGGIASAVGGWIISQNSGGQLVHYDLVGWLTVATLIICAVMMYFVNRYINTQLVKR